MWPEALPLGLRTSALGLGNSLLWKKSSRWAEGLHVLQQFNDDWQVLEVQARGARLGTSVCCLIFSEIS